MAFTYKKGLQIVNYFDLGRTQLLPPPGVAPQTVTKADKQLNTSMTALSAGNSIIKISVKQIAFNVCGFSIVGTTGLKANQ